MRPSVLCLLEEAYKKHPQRIAVQDEEGEITYSELRGMALSIGGYIQNIISKKHAPILVLLPKEKMNIPCFMGILYSGNIYCPTEVTYPINRIISLVSVLNPAMIITTTEIKEKTELNFENIPVAALEEIPLDSAVDVDKTFYNQIISTDPVYILFTSGSTGKPKGVVINNQNILDYIEWVIETFDFDEKDVFGNQAPFYFDNSTLDIYASIGCGACLSIIPKRFFSFPMELMEYVKDKEITSVFWVPSVLAAVANSDSLSHVKNIKLKKILFAGEVLQTKYLNYWMGKLNQALFVNLYGPTEITVDCTYYIVKEKLEDNELIPIGRPCRNTRVYLMDEKGHLIEEKDTIGEIVVEGISVSSGYWNNQEQTKEHFLQNSAIDSYDQKVYMTGDLAYYNEDYDMVFVGRKDTQIKHMGYRIELGEIETVVNSSGYIKAACAFYIESEIILVCELQKQMTEKEIRKYLRKLLPQYMIPGKIHIVDEIPLNSNGKIDRKRLRKEFENNE